MPAPRRLARINRVVTNRVARTVAGTLPGFGILEHTGRKSGTRRYVVLEVVEHPSPGTYLVVSGFGDRAQWFRNIRANRQVRVRTLSRGPAPATARILPQAEAAAALTAYSARHPRAWAGIKPVLQGTLGSPADEVETRLPVIAFELSRWSRRPPRRAAR